MRQGREKLILGVTCGFQSLVGLDQLIFRRFYRSEKSRNTNTTPRVVPFASLIGEPLSFVDRYFRPVLADQQSGVGQTHNRPQAQDLIDRALNHLPRTLVDDPKTFPQGCATARADISARELLRHPIQECYPCVGIGNDYGVANACERHFDQFFLVVQFDQRGLRAWIRP